MGSALLHAFNWSFAEVADEADRIQDMGYYGVLLSPPIYSGPIGSSRPWWQVYQPKDYRVISSHLGGKDDLVRAINALRDRGVKVYIDYVANHMANEGSFRSDPYHFPGASELDAYRDNEALFEGNRLYGDLSHGLYSPWDFHNLGTIGPGDYDDPYRVRHYRLGGLPDLRPIPWVFSQQRQSLLALADLGVDGFRIDAIKHLHLRHVQSVFEPLQERGLHLFGEVLTLDDGGERRFLHPFINETSIDAYDFPLFVTLREAFSFGGDLGRLLSLRVPDDALPGMRAVTFAVNHDLPLNQGFTGLVMDPTDERLAWAYLFTRDGGMPLVYAGRHERHDMAWPTPWPDRWADQWHSDYYRALMAFHNQFAGAPQYEVWRSAGCVAYRRGDEGLAVINKTSQIQSITFDSYGFKLGAYKDLVTGHSLRIMGGHVSLSVEPRSAVILTYC